MPRVGCIDGQRESRREPSRLMSKVYCSARAQADGLGKRHALRKPQTSRQFGKFLPASRFPWPFHLEQIALESAEFQSASAAQTCTTLPPGRFDSPSGNDLPRGRCPVSFAISPSPWQVEFRPRLSSLWNRPCTMVLPAPEVPSQMTEQNFDGIAVSTIEKKARVLPHWCTLGRMARAPPSLKITNQLCERHGINTRSGGMPPLRPFPRPNACDRVQ